MTIIYLVKSQHPSFYEYMKTKVMLFFQLFKADFFLLAPFNQVLRRYNCV